MAPRKDQGLDFSNKKLALPQGSLILVTGASGYIGSHVVNEALLAGYRVRGTSRTKEKCDQLKKTFNNHFNFTTIVVHSFNSEGAYDEAMKGCDAVIHLASDMTFSPDPNEVVTPVVRGMKYILRSAAKQPSVKRFVLTSSSTAVLLPSHDKPLRVSKDTWNDASVEKAWTPPPYTQDRATHVYSASKTEGEKALWEFMKTEKPNFVANAILPNVNMGRTLLSPGVTGTAVIDVLKGRVPPFPPQYMIDVIDDARLHIIAAVLDRSLENDRIFAFNVAFNWSDIIKAVKQVRPNAATIATPPKNEPRDLSEVPTEQGAKLLKAWYGQEMGYKPLIETVAENLEGYE